MILPQQPQPSEMPSHHSPRQYTTSDAWPPESEPGQGRQCCVLRAGNRAPERQLYYRPLLAVTGTNDTATTTAEIMTSTGSITDSTNPLCYFYVTAGNLERSHNHVSRTQSTTISTVSKKSHALPNLHSAREMPRKFGDQLMACPIEHM